MRHSHSRYRDQVCLQHPTYPRSIFSISRLRNAAGHVVHLLRTTVHVFFLYLILLLAVCISTQLITPPLAGVKIPVSDTIWSKLPNPHLGSYLMVDTCPYTELNDDCLHCFFGEWMTGITGISNFLSCPLHDEVTTTPVHLRPAHLLSMKCCTGFNAMIRKMVILMNTFLRQMALAVLVVFLSVSSLLHEEMLALSARRRGQKAASSPGERDVSSPCRKKHVFKFIFVHSPFTICVTSVKSSFCRYERPTVSKQLHSLLVKFPSLKLKRGFKCARRIHGHLVVSFAIQRSYVMHIRFRPPSFCLTLLRCIAHLVKEVLAQAVSVMPSVLLCSLLLQAGDVEVNPGPVQGGGTCPLSSWNNDALLFLREKLKLNVLMNTGLSDKLEKAAGGFMSEYEAEMVRQLPYSIAQVDKVIETLRKKENEDFRKFCKILRDSNQVVWADELERVAEQFKRVEEGRGVGVRKQVDSFSSCLVEFYMNMKVVEDEWLPADQALPFVNLALARFHLSAQNAQKMFVEAVREGADSVYTYQTGRVECEAIPGLVKKHKLVIISGAPGAGKSTLARKTCQDICKPPGCHDYIAVMLVELRDLLHFKKDFKLVDILQLFQGMMTHDVSLEKLSEAIYSNLGRGVLFILDGFDELPPHLRQSDFLVNLLSHNRDSLLRHCDVILTSRSIVTSEIYRQMQKSRSQVSLINIEVLGFTQDQIRIYAKQYFSDQGQPDLFGIFVKKIGAVPQIRGICSIPVVLSIICQVFLFREDLPPTLTQIYNDYLCVNVLKYNEDLSELDSILDLPKEHDIYKLGEIAYNCIQSHKIVFDSGDLQGLGERFSDRKRGCGVLTARPIRCDPKSRKGAIESFFFIHLTVQEFLAAIYVSLLTTDRQCEIWARYLGEPHMAQVWRFYCGLTKLEHFDCLQKWINSYPVDFQMHCLYETQDISLVHRLMPRIVGEEVDVRPETAYDSTAYGYCLCVLPSLKHLTIKSSTGSAEIYRLLVPVYASGTLQTLYQTDKDTSWRELEVALGRLVSLEREASTGDSQKDGTFKKHFGMVYLKGPPLSTVVKLLCLQHVTEIECSDIQRWETMDCEDLVEMERSLSVNKTMNRLTLSCGPSVTLPKQFCHHLLLGIRRSKSLSEVSLRFNPQSWYCPDDVPAGDRGSIQQFSLWYVPVDVFAKLLSFCSELQELECHSIHPPQEILDREVLMEMERSLSVNKTMNKLTLSDDHNVTLPKQFCCHLLLGIRRNKSLSELYLHFNPRSWYCPDDVPAGDQRSVQHLSLRGVPVTVFIKLLSFYSELQELKCHTIHPPQKAMDHEVLMEMERSLSVIKTMNKLTLSCGHGVTLPKQFCRHLLLGIRRNKSLSEVYLHFDPQSWYFPDDVPAGDQGSVQHLTLRGVPVDVFANLLSLCSEVKELKCPSICPPQEAMDHVVLMEMERSLSGNNTMNKLTLSCGHSVTLPKQFCCHLLLGIRRNKSLSEVDLCFYPRSWYCPDDVLAGDQESVQQFTLRGVPVDVLANLLSFCSELKELECHSIRPPQEYGVREDKLKLDEMEQTLAGMCRLEKLVLGMDGIVSRSLMVRFSMSALKGISKQHNIVEFVLYNLIGRENLLQDVLSRLPPDERDMFTIGVYTDEHGGTFPCICLSPSRSEGDEDIDGSNIGINTNGPLTAFHDDGNSPPISPSREATLSPPSPSEAQTTPPHLSTSEGQAAPPSTSTSEGTATSPPPSTSAEQAPPPTPSTSAEQAPPPTPSTSEGQAPPPTPSTSEGQAPPPTPSTSEGQAPPPTPSTSEGQAALPTPSTSEGQAARPLPVQKHHSFLRHRYFLSLFPPYVGPAHTDPPTPPSFPYCSALSLVLIVTIVLLFCLPFLYSY